jgi:hypothetical protein
MMGASRVLRRADDTYDRRWEFLTFIDSPSPARRRGPVELVRYRRGGNQRAASGCAEQRGINSCAELDRPPRGLFSPTPCAAAHLLYRHSLLTRPSALPARPAIAQRLPVPGATPAVRFLVLDLSCTAIERDRITRYVLRRLGILHRRVNTAPQQARVVLDWSRPSQNHAKRVRMARNRGQIRLRAGRSPTPRGAIQASFWSRMTA